MATGRERKGIPFLIQKKKKKVKEVKCLLMHVSLPDFSFWFDLCLFFELPSHRVEKDQGPQHLGLRPALKAFRSSPHTTWAPGDKTADCLC